MWSSRSLGIFQDACSSTTHISDCMPRRPRLIDSTRPRKGQRSKEPNRIGECRQLRTGWTRSVGTRCLKVRRSNGRRQRFAKRRSAFRPLPFVLANPHASITFLDRATWLQLAPKAWLWTLTGTMSGTPPSSQSDRVSLLADGLEHDLRRLGDQVPVNADGRSGANVPYPWPLPSRAVAATA